MVDHRGPDLYGARIHRANHRLFHIDPVGEDQDDYVLARALQATRHGNVPTARLGTANHVQENGVDLSGRLRRLAPDMLVELCAHEFSTLLSLNLTGQAVRLRCAEGSLLSLTFPAEDDLADAVARVKDLASLRDQRLPEIVAQAGAILPFLEDAAGLDPMQRGWTWSRHLMASAHRVVIGIEARVKLAASLPRPVEFDPDVRPILTTPAHSTWPSGHATEAFAVATLLAALCLLADGDATPVETLLTTLPVGGTPPPAVLALLDAAHRIAENRTVAGLHFPVDNLHGSLLGFCIGLAFAAALTRHAGKLPSFEGHGPGWRGEFTLDEWRGQLRATNRTVPVPPASGLPVVSSLWTSALLEVSPAGRG